MSPLKGRPFMGTQLVHCHAAGSTVIQVSEVLLVSQMKIKRLKFGWP